LEKALKEVQDHPVMIANSGYIDDNIKSLALKAGFQIVFQNPVSQQMINDEILKFLKSKQEALKTINSKISIIDIQEVNEDDDDED
jgi:hypothetical protein